MALERKRDRIVSNKEASHWYSSIVEQDLQLVRWGHYGTPVLVFLTAGGDAEEIERLHLLDDFGS